MYRVHKIFDGHKHNNGIIFYLGARSQEPGARSQMKELGAGIFLYTQIIWIYIKFTVQVWKEGEHKVLPLLSPPKSFKTSNSQL
jgi:hypothetical protein